MECRQLLCITGKTFYRYLWSSQLPFHTTVRLDQAACWCDKQSSCWYFLEMLYRSGWCRRTPTLASMLCMRLSLSISEHHQAYLCLYQVLQADFSFCNTKLNLSSHVLCKIHIFCSDSRAGTHIFAIFSLGWDLWVRKSTDKSSCST